MTELTGYMSTLSQKGPEESALLLNTFADLILDYEGKRGKFEIIVSAGDTFDEISFDPERALFYEEDDSEIFIGSEKTARWFTSVVEMKNIIKVNDLSTMNDVVKLVEAVRDGASIFGVLLTNGKGDYLNPAHPIVAKMIKEKGIEHWFPDGFTALIFPIDETEEELWEEEAKTFDTEEPYLVDDMEEEELHAVLIRDLPRVDRFYPENIITDIRSILIRMNVGLYEKKESNTPVIIPVQVMQRSGIAYPWYGAIWVKNGEQEYGVDLGPMFSANLSAGTEISDRDPDDIEYGEFESRICTGDLPIGFCESLGVLNTSNYDSQYKSMIGDFNVISIKEKMAAQSVKIYKKGTQGRLGLEEQEMEEEGNGSGEILHEEESGNSGDDGREAGGSSRNMQEPGEGQRVPDSLPQHDSAMRDRERESALHDPHRLLFIQTDGELGFDRVSFGRFVESEESDERAS